MTLMANSTGDQIDWVTGLIQRARKGDQHAFERLYREFSGRVYGLCLRMTRDPSARRGLRAGSLHQCLARARAFRLPQLLQHLAAPDRGERGAG